MLVLNGVFSNSWQHRGTPGTTHSKGLSDTGSIYYYHGATTIKKQLPQAPACPIYNWVYDPFPLRLMIKYTK